MVSRKEKRKKKMNNFNDIINDSKLVLVDFYADWCQPCKMVAPILEEVKTEMGDKLRIIKINVDKNQQLASKYGIRSIPTLMLFKQGAVKFSQAGVIPANEIIKIIANS
jgi:thioredoxin 1